MKKILALSICLILVAICFTGCTGKEETFLPQSYTADGLQITEISIQVEDRQIEVQPSADSQVHIAYFESDSEFYDISVLEGKLTMTSASDKDWTEYVGLKTPADSREIVVQLPDTLLQALTISTTNAPISLSSLAPIEAIDLSTQGGEIRFEQLNALDSIRLQGKNGDITGSVIGSWDAYQIACEIKKGDSNLPPDKTTGSKSLIVSNNNGDVNISFVEE